jgi:hypothetical protein
MNEKEQCRVYFGAPRDAITDFSILGRARHIGYDIRARILLAL